MTTPDEAVGGAEVTTAGDIAVGGEVVSMVVADARGAAPGNRADTDPAAAGPRRILGIALPTLGVLVAEPLYLLWDTAVVGRLGAAALAGLAVGGLVLGQVSTQLTFLTYGTTARSARRFGSGDRRGAIEEGVQASWVAIVVGALIVLVAQLCAGPVTRLIAGGADIADAAASWLRIAVCGVPLILLTMAGNGWLRGVQQTRRPLMFVVAGLGVSAVLCPVLVHGLLGAPRLALAGSAIANLTGQLIAAGLFVNALMRQHVSLAPRPVVMRAQLVLGRDLIMRSLAFQACFVSAGAVAARFGAAAVAGHQLVLQLWNFLALTLDSLAIAAQTLIGAALGGGDISGAVRLTRRITVWSLLFAAALAVVFAAGVTVIPRLFTVDPQVLDRVGAVWWFFVTLIPVAGVVFALDGVLLGAGDAVYLRNTTMVAALIGFLPMIWLSLAYDWGIAGIWSGLSAFVVLRLIAVSARALSGRWARPGTEIPRGAG